MNLNVAKKKKQRILRIKSDHMKKKKSDEVVHVCMLDRKDGLISIKLIMLF